VLLAAVDGQPPRMHATLRLLLQAAQSAAQQVGARRECSRSDNASLSDLR